MDPRDVFDDFLKKGDKGGAFDWVMEKLAWDPDSTVLLGISAFAFFLHNQSDMAYRIAEDVLKEDPENEWALATIFACTYRLESKLDLLGFHAETGFRLDHQWIRRFACADKKEESRKVVYCLSRYGSPDQRAQLSENWLVGKVPAPMLTGQLELDLGVIPSRKK
jgi:hypothetical protein